jgi:hypothetical protein
MPRFPVVTAAARTSSLPGGAAWSPRGEHAIVTLRRRWLRTLQALERDVARFDPGLDALFQGFARRTGGCDMSWIEKLDRRRFLRFGRRRRERTLTERMKDWTAENWKDP